MSRPPTLAHWLDYLETLHPKSIAMGLDRIRAVYDRMQIALDCVTITVTGTNGKGSTCAMLASMYRAAGFRVGLYSSPHLTRYNERVLIDGQEASDSELVAALNAVEDARIAVRDGPATPLTYFEFGTLAALWLFARARLDVMILEVGLGGRLDAVNIIDADVAVVTSVALDHMDYLGSTREEIGREKAGIFRRRRPIVCAEPQPPATMIDYAAALEAPMVKIGRDYGYTPQRTQWEYWGPGGLRAGLPCPALRGRHQLANAATAIAAADVLQPRLPLDNGAIRDGLVSVTLHGRFQVQPGRPVIVLDVAHNPHAALVLAETLGTMGYHPQTRAVFGMLSDKDIAGVVEALAARVDEWFVASLPGPRGANASRLRSELLHAGVAPSAIHMFDGVACAFDVAQAASSEADRILVFGSFLTVAAALAVPQSGRSAVTTLPHG